MDEESAKKHAYQMREEAIQKHQDKIALLEDLSF